jgi:hypothetical protein
MCRVSAGVGQAKSASAIITGLAGTALQLFSYDSPVVTYVESYNTPTTGGSSTTLSGFNFGLENFSPTVRTGKTECTVSLWVSQTSLKCQVTAGYAADVTKIITVNSVLGTQDSLFSYDSPLLSYFTTPNGVTSSPGSLLTMIGINFANHDTTPTFMLGTSACSTASWTSFSTLTCQSAGVGTMNTASAFISSLIGTQMHTFSYDAPVMTHLEAKNAAVSGGSTVTIAGMNFAEMNYTPSLKFSAVGCLTTSWSSHTSTICTPPTISGSSIEISLTISTVVGTQAGEFSYDSPVVSALHTVNAVSTGGANMVISVHGTNFVNAQTTPTVRLGSSICATTVWTGDTEVKCFAASGTGAGQHMMLTISTVTGTKVASFSYDAPVLTHSSNWNSPSTGGASVTVMGLNFGEIATTATVYLGSTLCGTTSWSSATALVCRSLERTLLGNHKHAAVTISSGVGTVLYAFSYDAPAISRSAPANLPNSLSLSMTLNGVNFGGYDTSPSATVGSSHCTTTVWWTDTAVRCYMGTSNVNGVGAAIKSAMTISQLVGTMMMAFTFDSPAVTHAYHYNLPTSGMASVTLSGFNFGAYSDYTPSVRIGSTGCGTSTWTSVSTVRCTLPSGDGAGQSPVMTIASLTGTISSAFTYDSPVISTFNVQNGALSGGTSISISGANFGKGNLSPSATVGGSACQTTAWRSDTTIVCTNAPGDGTGREVHVTVSAMVATKTVVFSFDAPLISYTNLYNTPTTAGGQITVEGVNFGSSDYTPTIRVESTMCGTTSWSTSSSVVCVASYGSGISRNVAISLSSVMGTALGLFSYDSPLVTALTQANAPTTGGKSMTIQGHNFAVIDSTVTSLIGVSSCSTTSWTSASVVMCLLGAASAGPDYQVAVTLGGLIGTKQKVFTFDAPIISLHQKPNAPLSGEPSITMIGTNFATQDYSPNAFVGQTICRTTSWMSVTSTKCFVEGGFAGLHTTTLTVATLSTTSVHSFTYDSPSLTHSVPFNAPNAAGLSVTVSGHNFGFSDYSVTVQVAETACLSSKWISSTSSLCQLAPGAGVGPAHPPSITPHRIAITVGTGVGTRGRAFTFDGPVVTHAGSFNSANSGGKSVTVNGVNFGLTDYSVTVGIGKTACMTTSWTTGTALKCAAPSGYGAAHQVSVTVVHIDGTIKSVFSYDAPVLSILQPTNSASSGGSVLTINGVGFGSADNSLTVSIGQTDCASTSWTTTSTVQCRSSVSYGSQLDVLITLGGLVGTEYHAFSYDAPVVSFAAAPTNGPISGGAGVTMYGHNFGSIDFTATAMVSSTECATTVWTSGTHVECLTSAGHGQAHALVLNLGGLAGTYAAHYSYDAPVVTILDGLNGAVTSGTRVTVSGSDFGAISLTPTVRIGKSRCATSSWMSATSLTCVVHAGTGSQFHAAVDMFGLGTYEEMFTYDAPILSHSLTLNGPTSGGVEVTMQGLNFGMSNTTPSIRVSHTGCASTLWLSDTAAVCTSAGGHGHDHHKSVTISGQAGTIAGQFTFDGVLISDIQTANAPHTGKAMLTVHGLNFAATDLSPTATMMHHICFTSSWTSSTAIQCSTRSGYGDSKNFGLTMSTVVGTILTSFTFDSPAVTAIVPANMPVTAGPSLTVLGLQFVSVDLTPTTTFHGASSIPCTTLSWSTSTTVKCNAGTTMIGTGQLSTSITMGTSLAATLDRGFTYDAPALSFSDFVNGPTSGGSFVTVTGLNFYSNDMSNTVSVGGAACSTSAWQSATTLHCVTSPASGIAQSVSAEVSSVHGTFGRTFTFDAPTTSSFATLNSPATSGASISIYGNNFGTSDFTPSVQIGATTCATVMWSTTTSINCRAAGGYKHDLTGSLSISLIVGTHTTESFSYDSPVVSHLNTFNGPTTLGSTISIEGMNFAGVDSTPTVRLGQTSCATSVWIGTTSLLCTPTAQAGAGYSAVVDNVLMGTLVEAFSYDSPVVTHLFTTANSPTSGMAQITFHGTNFGASDFSGTAFVGVTVCASSDWGSTTSILCLAPVGHGIKNMAGVTVADLVGTKNMVFTYDTAVLSAVAPFNSPTTGLSSITLTGFNFMEAYDPTPSARVGMTSCQTTSWSSVSSLTCLSSIGIGADHAVSATLGGMIGTAAKAFTYDTAVITQLDARNMPTTAGMTITLSGVNFGVSMASPTVKIGGLDCTGQQGVSDTSITCRPSVGVSHSHSVAMTISSMVGTLQESFTYDAPLVTFVHRYNGATSGTTLLTLSGMNLGPSDTTAVVSVGGTSTTACQTSAWQSDSSILCQLAPGAGVVKTLNPLVGGLYGTSSGAFSYDAPIVTRVALTNAAGTATLSVTVAGMNFAMYDSTVSVVIGLTKCGTVSWSTHSSLKCFASNSGHGIALGVSVEAGAAVTAIGTAVSLFTYDAPMVTYLSPLANSPSSAGVTVTVHGANFGYIDLQGSAYIGVTMCSATTYTTDTSVSCTVPPGAGNKKLASFWARDGVQKGTAMKMFTYDAPVVTHNGQFNGPAKAGAFVSIEGTNFGVSKEGVRGVIGGNLCARTDWVSTTAVSCLSPDGTNVGHMVGVIVQGLLGSKTASFSYDAPLLTHVSTYNAPMVSSAVLTLFGLNFGTSDESPTVSLGTSRCASTIWMADSSVGCVPVSGASTGLDISLSVGSLGVSMNGAFTHDSPIITDVAVLNGPTGGGAIVSIAGNNFGHQDLSSTAKVSLNACSATSYVSATSVLCTLPAGAGVARLVNAEVAGLVGTAAATFTYDAPSIAAVAPTNALYIGVTQVTLTGNNFASTAVASVGGVNCVTTTFVSATSIACQVPPQSALTSTAQDVAVVVGDASGMMSKQVTFDGTTVVATQVAGTTAAALDLTTGGKVAFQVNNETDYHKYAVTGALTLGGQLHIEFAKGFTPARTTCFELFSATSVTGSFANITTSLKDGAPTVCSTGPVFSVKVTVPGCDTLYPTCNGRGTCSSSTGLCTCNAGYSGSACDSACFYNKTTAAFDCTCAANLPDASTAP